MIRFGNNGGSKFENNINNNINNNTNFNNLSINMYDEFPKNLSIKLSNLFDIIYSKIKILGEVEECIEDSKLKNKFYDYEAIYEKLNSEIRIFGTENEIISFWMCLLGYQSAKLEWYIYLEKIIFKSRLKNIYKTDKQIYKNILENKFGKNNFKKIKDTDYLLVDFEYGLDLLSRYEVLIHNGRIQIDDTHFEELIINLFENNIRRKLRRIKDNIKIALDNDPRIKKIIKIIPEVSTYKNEFQNTKQIITDRIKKEDLPILAEKCFPLCMSEMYKSLKSTHVLKHFGRIQFGSFLKGINMDNNECKDFFMNEFSKLDGKKLKEYSYYIDHLYGLQGKKTDYSPWGCDSIAKRTPGAKEVFGCPFKYYSDNNLKTLLIKKIGYEGAEEILEIRKDSSFNLACKALFYKIHPNAQERKGIGKHPNSYFQSSFYLFKQKNKIQDNKMKEETNGINNLTEKVVYTNGIQEGGIPENEYQNSYEN